MSRLLGGNPSRKEVQGSEFHYFWKWERTQVYCTGFPLRSVLTHLEVVLEPVPDEDATGVDEVAQLLVRRLQRRQVLRAEVGIQIAWKEEKR